MDQTLTRAANIVAFAGKFPKFAGSYIVADHNLTEISDKINLREYDSIKYFRLMIGKKLSKCIRLVIFQQTPGILWAQVPSPIENPEIATTDNENLKPLLKIHVEYF